MWQQRIGIYLHYGFHLWQSTYIELGGNPEVVLSKKGKTRCNWWQELDLLRICSRSHADLFRYATQAGDITLIKFLLEDTSNITTNDIATPIELDGNLFNWNKTNKEWVAFRCLLKDKHVYLFDGDKLVQAIEMSKAVEVKEVTFWTQVLFLVKTPNTIFNFRAPSQCARLKWIEMISRAQATTDLVYT